MPTQDDESKINFEVDKDGNIVGYIISHKDMPVEKMRPNGDPRVERKSDRFDTADYSFEGFF